jgi:hypothetical protein
MKIIFQKPTIYKQFGLKTSAGSTQFGTRCRPSSDNSSHAHNLPEASKPPAVEKN